MCMTVEISAEEVGRDQDSYRLSLTASPEGGDAPYTYQWATTIGTLLSGQGTSQIEVEVPIGAGGIVSISVQDSGTPACSASAALDFCALFGDFTAFLVTSPPQGQNGPYVYQCQATTSEGTAPFTYEWTPAPDSVVEPDGGIVRISFSDDARHEIHLKVTDSSDCEASKTHKVGKIGYTVECDPGDATGTLRGQREGARFEVDVTSTADETVESPDADLTLEFKRPATGETYDLTLTLVDGSSPTKYTAIWGDVTTMKGKWEIKVKNGRSNTVTFKIDKRQQIVQLAQHWAGQGLPTRFYPSNVPPGSPVLFGECSSFVGYIYNRVGLSSIGYDASGGVCSLGNAATETNAQDGDIRVYAGGGHYAILAGGGMIDNNNGAYTDPAIIGSPGPTARQLDDSTTLNIYSTPSPVSKSLPELNVLDAE